MGRKYDHQSLECSLGLCNHSKILIQASALSLSQWVSNHFPSSLRNKYMISTNALKCRGDDAWIACIVLLHMHHVWADHTLAFKVVAVAHQTDTVVKLLRSDSIHSVEALNQRMHVTVN